MGETPMLLMGDRKSTRLNSSHTTISYAVFCLQKNTPRSPDPVTTPHARRPSHHPPDVPPHPRPPSREHSPPFRYKLPHQPALPLFFLITRPPPAPPPSPPPRLPQA